jgi:hypothetical protein
MPNSASCPSAAPYGRHSLERKLGVGEMVSVDETLDDGRTRDAESEDASLPTSRRRASPATTPRWPGASNIYEEPKERGKGGNR